jgi:hypothetical protein
MKRLMPLLGGLLVVACGSTPRLPGVGPSPMPGLLPSVASGANPLGTGQITMSQPRFRACLTRYDFAGSSPALPNAECTSEVIDGDPTHWKILCPKHPRLEEVVEVKTDAVGQELFVKHTGSNYETPVVTVLRSDSAGRPLEALYDYPDNFAGWPGSPAPGTGEQRAVWTYDDFGRVVQLQVSFRRTGIVNFSFHVTYDDAGRRILYDSVVDYSSVLVGSGGPGQNGGYDLFDEDLKLVERSWTTAGDVEPSSTTFAYDAQGRLTTTAYLSTSFDRTQYIEHQLYDCP